jgi:hypothetical protein
VVRETISLFSKEAGSSKSVYSLVVSYISDLKNSRGSACVTHLANVPTAGSGTKITNSVNSGSLDYLQNQL